MCGGVVGLASDAVAAVETYAGGTITTGAGAWAGSGVLYSGHFDLTQSDLTVIVNDVDMSASINGTWVSLNNWSTLPTHIAGIQAGITNLTALGTGINPINSAGQNLLLTGSKQTRQLSWPAVVHSVV